MKKLHHNNILPLIGYIIREDAVLLFTPLLDFNLSGVLKDRTKKMQENQLSTWFSVPEVENFCQQILNGLEYLHTQQIAHRDIKSENILVFINGLFTVQKLCIADFGIAIQIVKNQKNVTKIGTEIYMAPEVQNETSYDPLQSDMWSFGVVLNEMLTGNVSDKLIGPFKVQSTKLKDIVSRCLSHNPSERPTSKQLLQVLYRK